MARSIGITGGIGSGKSYICREFGLKYGILIYYSDVRARVLMENDPNLRKLIIDEFGQDSYIVSDERVDDTHFTLNRDKFTKLLFSDETSRYKMNSIVHPFVRDEYYKLCEWSPDYVLFESAILFDGEDRIKTDYNILVVADMDVRIKRVQERNLIGVEDIMKRINVQTSNDFKRQFADYVITNNGDEDELDKQINEVHQKILSL